MKHSIAALCAIFFFALCSWNGARGQSASGARSQVSSLNPADESGPETPARVISPVNENKLVQLTGNTHPMARPEFDCGPVDPALPMERLILVLERSPEQEAALTKFMDRQLDPASPDYHHWLEPAEFGALYGPAEKDIQAVSAWLESHNFTVDKVAAGRMFIEFSGTEAMVEQAFHTSIHRYEVEGEAHIANNADPSIPEALRPVIAGVLSLNDFFAKPMHIGGDTFRRDPKTGRWSPIETDGMADPLFGFANGGASYQFVSPWDFAAIYNVTPLWNSNIDGTGVTIAIAGRSNISLTDVSTFRSAFGLPAKLPNVVLNGTDPGFPTVVDREENTLDVEWSGAVAKGANIKLVTTKTTATTGGDQASALYIVDNKVAPIMSFSYGGCELGMGTTQNAAFSKMWQQGAAEGISIFVASGDSGAATCDSAWKTFTAANNGLAVNGMASTPYNAAVGGTDLDWANLTGTYWAAKNDANSSSALGYIPEVAWNGSCASDDVDKFLGLFKQGLDEEGSCNNLATNKTNEGYITVTGSGGGQSSCTTTTKAGTCASGYSKPTWQTGTGVPADGARDLPDLALYASYLTLDSAYVYCDSSSSPCTFTDPADTFAQGVGGTSAASPAMAGIMALVLQNAGGAPQGLPNPVFYKLAAKDNLTNCNPLAVAVDNSCVFYDITADGNAEPCLAKSANCKFEKTTDTVGILTNYKATKGYDQVTGLGSVNASNLVTGWSSAAPVPTLSISPSSLTFASTNVGSSTASQTVTLTNTGKAWLNFPTNTVGIFGGDAGSFPTRTTCTAPLAPGGTCTATVTFTPTTGGSLSSTLQFGDNVAGSPQKVPLKGTGVALPPAVTLSTLSLTFPSTVVGKSSPSQTVTVKNTGKGPLTIPAGGITMQSGSTTAFLATSDCTAPVAPGASCTITVTFTPNVAGSLETNLTIADNAPGSPQSVLLKGTATPAPSLTVTLSQSSITFYSQTPGTTSVFQAIYAANTSPYDAIKLGPFTITGTDASNFEQISDCGASLPVGASCYIYFAFRPKQAGSFQATFNFKDAVDPTQTVTLKGTAPPLTAVTLSPKTLTFAATAKGTTSTAQPVALTNSGTSTLQIASIQITGANASSFIQLNSCLTFLVPSLSCQIEVAFQPATTGTLTANLVITDTANGSPQTVTLTGTGK